MTAATYDILIEQGATFRLNLIWKDSNNTPVNLSGYSARMQIRRTHRSEDILLSLTSATGAITLGGSAGTVNIIASATGTATLPAKDSVYDLELASADGTVTRIIEGGVTITPEVTR
jgi:hypothetical protein